VRFKKMTTAILDVESSRMAKAKGRPKKPGGEGTQVRIDTDLVSMARYVCAKSGESMIYYLSGILRSKVEKDFHKAGEPLRDKNP
jgi:hypothetical protein